MSKAISHRGDCIMGRIFLVATILALAGCQDAPTPQAMAHMNMAENGTPTIPPAVSRPIVEPDGNIVQCTAYPGPGSAGACIQK
jgi:hypothetical protein